MDEDRVMGKLLHQLQLLRESSPGWARAPQTHSPTDFCQNRISYLSHICHDKTRNSFVSAHLEKGKEVFAEKPGQTSKLLNTQSPPGQLCLVIVSYLRYVWFLSPTFNNWRRTHLPSVWKFCHILSLKANSHNFEYLLC